MMYRASDMKPAEIGVQMHAMINRPFKSFVHMQLIEKLKVLPSPFSRRLNNGDVIIGKPDDFETDGKQVSIIELYTFSGDLNQRKIKAKAFQLQTYIWVMEPILLSVGYHIAEYHKLMVYEQSTKELFTTIMVEKDENIEEHLNDRINS
jgi:hypothetical protein